MVMITGLRWMICEITAIIPHIDQCAWIRSQYRARVQSVNVMLIKKKGRRKKLSLFFFSATRIPPGC